MPIDKVPSEPTEEELKEAEQIRQIENRAKQIALANDQIPDGYAEFDAAGNELVPLVESPALNKLLLRNARKPVNDIALITGIPADEVSERLVRLLEAPPIQDDIMAEQLVLAEIAMLADDIRTRMNRSNLDDEAFMSGARVQLATSKTILEQLDKRRKNLDGKLALINEIQGQMIVNAIRINNQLTAESLARKFGVTEDVVYAEWEDNYPKAVAIVEGAQHNASQ